MPDRAQNRRDLAANRFQQRLDEIRREREDRLRYLRSISETPPKFAHFAFGVFRENAIKAIHLRVDLYRDVAREYDDVQMLTKPALEPLRIDIETDVIYRWSIDLKAAIDDVADAVGGDWHLPGEPRYKGFRGELQKVTSLRLKELSLESEIGPRGRDSEALSPAQRIAAFAAGTSYTSLAKKAGISRNTLKRIREGKSVHEDSIAKLAHAMNCNCRDLLP